MATVILEARPYRPFKSSEEYLYAMREDLAEWLNTMYPELDINVENFMDRLDTGVALCKHANNVREAAEEYLQRRQARLKSMTKSMTSGSAGPILALGHVQCIPNAKSGTFFARDNVSNFITWCRKGLSIYECLLFETDDLIMRKNEKHVILCLLEVARRGAKFGMLAPMLVQMERQIDREIAADNRANGVGCGTQTENSGCGNGTNTTSTGTEGIFDADDSESEDESEDNGPMLMYGPMQQIITNDLKSLDEMVRDLVERCTCPTQFPMIRVSEGKYRIGDTKVLIFVRILRSHVMVRVGGGWDTLSHYLDKHDPCRCRAQHRTALNARLVARTNANNGIELNKAQVYYERSPTAVRKFNGVAATGALSSPGAVGGSRSRSKSPSKMSPPLRSSSPSYKRVVKKPSFESSVMIVPQEVSVVDGAAKEQTEVVNKYDNTSDNGSEISDEGYRSLGLIQNNKRASMHSQASNEDADNGARLESTSTDSQVSPCDEQCLKIVETDVIEPSTATIVTEPPLPEEKFAKSGIVITDDEITVDISSATGLRKTGFSEQMYTEGPRKTTTTTGMSRIPRTPTPTRRKSVDNLCMTEASEPLSRKIPQYRSVRKPTAASLAKEAPKENTWSGRTQRRRPSIGNETYQSHSKPNSPSPNRKMLERTPTRPPVQYDQNGRRIKPISASANTSPIKGRMASPLAQQFLEVVGEAQDDRQILEKMKALLELYSKSESKYDDFTTAWVKGNGTVDHSSINNSPTSQQPQQQVAMTTKKSEIPKEPRRATTGTSRIPAPVRSNTGLY